MLRCAQTCSCPIKGTGELLGIYPGHRHPRLLALIKTFIKVHAEKGQSRNKGPQSECLHSGAGG